MSDNRQTTERGRGQGMRRRAPRVLLVAALVLSLPAIALANHQFSDVPTSSLFHANIAQLVGSGITAGCGSGKYCPKATVTREQMAAFLSRGLGRTAWGTGAIRFDESDEFYVAVVDVAAGGASGGFGFITLQTNLLVYTEVDGLCPCTADIFLMDDATNVGLWGTGITVTDDGLADARLGNAGFSAVVRVPSGSPHRYGLVVDVRTTGVIPPGQEGQAMLQADIAAQYSPFGPTGGSTLGTENGPESIIQPDGEVKHRVKPGG